MAEVRTIRIDSNRPAPRRPPDPVKAAVGARPDRVAMWAVLLGVFLTVVAAATGHARSSPWARTREHKARDG